jgi:PAS domain S-box-containing protein
LVTARDISEIEALKLEKKRFEKRFQVMFSALNDAVFLHPLVEESFDYFAEVNDSACEKYGYTREEFLQMSAPDITEKEIAEYHKTKEHRKLLHEKGHMIFDAVHIKKNGEKFPVEINSSIFVDDGKTFILSVVRDLSERKKAAETIAEKELLYKSLANSGQAFIWNTDINKECTYVNDIWLNYTGRSLEEELGHGWLESIHEADRLACKEIFEEAFEKREKCSISYRLRRHDGEYRWIQDDGSPLYNQSGEFIGYIGHCLDIQAQRDLLKLVQEKEELLEEAQKVAKLGSYSFQIAKQKWFSSKGLDIIFGIDSDYERSYQGWLDIIHPEDLDEMNLYVTQEVIQKQQPFDKRYRIVQQSTKETRWVHGLGNLKTNEEGELYLFGIIQDITENIKIENELIHAKDKAEESDQLKTAFLANMSHEIRTPMNGILGFSSLLKNKDLDDDKKNTYLDVIEKSGYRMQNIVNDLIDISKIEAGQIELNLQRQSVFPLLTDLHEFFKLEAQVRKLDFNFELDDKLKCLQLSYDRPRLSQVLTNLLKNAFKFTNKGSVELKAYVSNTDVHFHVKDTGIGIAEDMQSVVFERFRQADPSFSSKYDGAGLGLSISAAFVEMHGGKLEVNSQPGQGSEFYFSIPITHPLDDLDDEFSTGKRRKKDQMPSVLIAEDDEVSYQYLNEIFALHKISTLRAKSGAEVIQKLFKHRDIAFILMDLKMPVMDGIEATQRIKRMNPKIPIIAQTAFAHENDREKAIKAGCDDYISKPIEKEVLEILIRKYIGTED